ncbi:hypothetical protein EJ03DRAFT_326951 [Teratosphaeria nubilosa]|uniref:Acyltransferase 3 domain-containing protein n=1 Tax=Teratosphaeria nubilosa TaxID=161662 RepID=A0A6G1LBN1_9PEZI|nr:hypothetical protein EJ03DRAFT_326951 [Teratosphaeria nubilosa]
MEPKDPQHDAILLHEAFVTETTELPLTSRDTVPLTKNNTLTSLDGLRGIAALIVYFHHHVTEYYGINNDLEHPYGYQGRYHFGQWRFVQLFFAGGTPAVMMFFVLSGYVLSRGALQMVWKGEGARTILRYLLTAVLRRPIRLWLPPILVSLPVVLAMHTPLRPLGGFTAFQPNIFAELRTYFIRLLQTINPFIMHGPFAQSFDYNPPVWTMAYELNGSMLVYAMMAICGPFLCLRNRMLAFTIAVFVAFEYGHFSLVPFVLGMMIAELDVASLDQPYIDRMTKFAQYLLFSAMAVIGWYFLSDFGPLIKPERPWFGLSGDWIPFIFYHNPNFVANIMGACCLVYAALRLSWLQNLLTRAGWLGRVSFGLYLTHVPVIWFFSHRVRRCFGYPLGEAEARAFTDGWLPIPDIGPLGLTTRYLAMQLVVLPLNLILAEVVTVWIDQTSVTVSKRFAARVMQKIHI